MSRSEALYLATLACMVLLFFAEGVAFWAMLIFGAVLFLVATCCLVGEEQEKLG